MLFDQVGELPVATVRRAKQARLDILLGDLEAWFVAKWQWFKPRTVPVAVAFVGMLGVIQAVTYLSSAPEPTATASIVVNTGPSAAMIFVDGKPYRNGQQVPDLQPSVYRVRLVLQQ